MTPSQPSTTLDKNALREIMGHYVTGATVVTATHAGQPHGMAVNSFTSVSLDPPLVLFCPSRASDTWPSIERAGVFAVNILGRDQDALCRQFAAKSVDRFSAADLMYTPRGNPVLAQAIAFLECEIDHVHEAGDHYVTIGRVLDLGVQRDGPPLVFYQGTFHGLAVAAEAPTTSPRED